MNLSFEQRRRMEGFFFVLPGIIVVLAVLGYPLVYNIVLSLKNMKQPERYGTFIIFL